MLANEINGMRKTQQKTKHVKKYLGNIYKMETNVD